MNLAPGQSVDFDPSTARPAPYRGAAAEAYRWLCRLYLRLSGWRRQGDWPDYPKAVLCAAPHTSNWDGIYMLAAAGAWRAPIAWMGKQSLTTGPLGGLAIWAGCVPIDRAASNDVVRSMAGAFAARERMLLLIPPEGTRGRAARWKSGFYHIADLADVPIVFTVLDYKTRTMRVAGAMRPSGNYDADYADIQRYYASAVGKHPDRFALDGKTG